jgi:hypothetical protein
MFKSVSAYIEDLSQREFDIEFKTMIASAVYTKQNYCRYCYKKNELRKNFSKILGLYILNSNNILIFGCYLTEFRIFLEKNKLEFGHTHIKHHRKRYWRNNIKRFKLITNSNTGNASTIDSHPMAI